MSVLQPVSFGPLLRVYRQTECSVCLQPLSAKPETMQPYETEAQYSTSYFGSCGHEFHEACAKRWARSKKGATVPCPNCKHPWPAVEVTELRAGMMPVVQPKAANIIIRTEAEFYDFIMSPYRSLRELAEQFRDEPDSHYFRIEEANISFLQPYYPEPSYPTYFFIAFENTGDGEQCDWRLSLVVTEDEFYEGPIVDERASDYYWVFCEVEVPAPKGFNLAERVLGAIGSAEEADVYGLFCRLVREVVSKAYLDVAGEQRGGLLNHPFRIIAE